MTRRALYNAHRRPPARTRRAAVSAAADSARFEALRAASNLLRDLDDRRCGAAAAAGCVAPLSRALLRSPPVHKLSDGPPQQGAQPAARLACRALACLASRRPAVAREMADLGVHAAAARVATRAAERPPRPGDDTRLVAALCCTEIRLGLIPFEQLSLAEARLAISTQLAAGDRLLGAPMMCEEVTCRAAGGLRVESASVARMHLRPQPR